MNFAKALEKACKKAKITLYGLARDAEVDSGYVYRLERGEQVHPSRDVVLRLGQALLDCSGDISLADVDQLLKTAGYGPLPPNRVSIRPYR